MVTVKNYKFLQCQKFLEFFGDHQNKMSNKKLKFNHLSVKCQKIIGNCQCQKKSLHLLATAKNLKCIQLSGNVKNNRCDNYLRLLNKKSKQKTKRKQMTFNENHLV